MTTETYKPPAFKLGDLVAWSYPYNDTPLYLQNIYEVVEPPPGTPLCLCQQYVWIRSQKEWSARVTGHAPTHLVQVCKHCCMSKDDHADQGKCLYGPTSFA